MSTKPLIAIKSCDAHATRNQLVRATWLMHQSVNYRFFIGNNRPHDGSDVVSLNCGDHYEDLPFKTQAICRWCLDSDVTHVFLCDTDTYVCTPRLLSCDFELHDYVGFFIRCQSCESDDGYCCCPTLSGDRMYSYASGGSGYWLSRRAMQVVADAKFVPDVGDAVHSHHGEDLQVGWALGRAGIICHRDERYRLRWPGPLVSNEVITLHDGSLCVPASQILEFIHRTWLTSGGR